MTSELRHELRYQRRKSRRLSNKLNRSNSVGTLEDVFSYRNLYKAGKKCCNGVRWKSSVQRFELHLFSGTAKRKKQILNGTWKPSPYNNFKLSERGKVRDISAPRIHDRQVHKVLTTKVLLPLYLPDIIWNNGASLPGKGYKFSKDQLKKELRHHYTLHGKSGSIILLDYKGFFPNALHSVIYKRHERLIYDEGLRTLADSIISSVPGGRGLPIGVEPSQAEMVAFPSPLDNMMKCQMSIKDLGHYMDDYHVLLGPNINPKVYLQEIKEKCDELGLILNLNKTKIVSISKPFKYCKCKYSITDNGGVLIYGSRDSYKRARRKFKLYKNKICSGMMTYEDLWASVNGIFAYFKGYNSHNRF